MDDLKIDNYLYVCKKNMCNIRRNCRCNKRV